MRKSHLPHGAILLLVVFLTGCAGWRPAREPEMKLPESFLRAETPGTRGEERWWPDLQDPHLDRLMERAFDKNLTLEVAVARLQQARHAKTVAQSSLFPSILARGSYTDAGEVGDPETPPFELQNLTSYSASLTASYEIDLWGKLTAGRGAAVADLLASEENLRAFVLTTAASVARTYYLVVELRQQRGLLEKTIRSYEDSYELVSDRYRRGVAPSLDVYQAQTNLAGARASMALTEGNLAAAEHTLSILIGEAPRTGLVPRNVSLPEEIAPVPPGLPTDLIQRRPDVRAAYWRLMAADRRAAQAVADRLPSLSLTGSVSGSDDELSDLLDPDGMIWRAIGNLVLPIFEGGRRKANADRAEAAWREHLANYKLAVLSSLSEVENALARGRRQVEYVGELETQVGAAEASLRLATNRYLQGVAEYLQVVVAQTALFNANRNLISARRGLIDLRIGLATALGGTWTETVVDERMRSQKLREKGEREDG